MELYILGTIVCAILLALADIVGVQGEKEIAHEELQILKKKVYKQRHDHDKLYKHYDVVSYRSGELNKYDYCDLNIEEL